MPIIIFAMLNQYNIPPILNELERPTRRRGMVFGFAANSICLVVYGLVASLGYLTFFDEVEGNILLNYKTDTAIIIGRLAVACVALFSLPLMSFPFLANVDANLFPGRSFSWRRRMIEVAVTMSTVYVLALIVRDLTVPMGLAGSTGSVMIGYILPSLFYLRLQPRPEKWWRSAHQLGAMATVGLGFVFMVMGVIMTLVDAFTSSGTEILQCGK
eukprot:NODE_719_length_1209_cov_226.924138_g518_i0.p1 GENE.NODE_719_length_1209_cov_226.924138_g518_i0~~NODE_719_length_1209_cov_226.924138_g518_i0.p1  ORF type:complete len:214 (+),score=80.14 NODE_719_length_1209_cov_226.924138_g518_i0:150-791(+)